MKKIIPLVLLIAFGLSVYGQYEFTDSSICAGLSMKQIEGVPYLKKCSNDTRDIIVIPEGESFVITGVDSCIASSRVQYKYIIRYKSNFHLVDTAFAKTIDGDVFKKFRLVKDKFKAMQYGVFVEHVLNKPQDLIKIDQVDKQCLEKSIASVTAQIRQLKEAVDL